MGQRLLLPGVLLGLACGGRPVETPEADAGSSGPVDAGQVVQGQGDAGGVDAGEVDAGGVDASGVDAGGVDAGEVDAGEADAGEVDAGAVDAGAGDSGIAMDAGAVTDAGFQDACAAQTPQCPGTPLNLVEGGGLRAINRCAFPISPAAGFRTNGALLDALEQRTTPVTLSQVVADANRVATPATSVPGSPAGLAWAFEWNAEDQASTAWIPQGITGSADGDPSGLVASKRIVLVSFYEDAGLNKGVRIAFVDVTNPNGLTFLSSSAPVGGGGAPYSVNLTGSRTANYSDSPEEMVDEAHGVLWGLSEAAGARAVFAVRFTSYPGP